MKKAKIFYNPIEGSGPLSISWYAGPKGDAVEAKNEIGVGFFSPTGELLGVIFDDVAEKKDHQILEFDRYHVSIEVNDSNVEYKIIKKITPSKQLGIRKRYHQRGNLMKK